MNKFEFVPGARKDLRTTLLYIAKHNPTAAAKFRELFFKQFQLLADHPRLGQPREDLAPSVRITAVRNYAVLYRPTPDGVEIIQIIHSSRDLPAVFRKPDDQETPP